ncbi:hypothetical protein C8A00DRAFT_19280 [Chaetomidium leptoderma]|uniref:Uncharacterized protein n=1 Tax=Chaetomidium leptoderma TaxID=669021 RepID=A0AAN6VCP5_9PEZI|nr:hypothetical protein C8A00DRAFT_19280 [Chaetomidium leptoderma]
MAARASSFSGTLRQRLARLSQFVLGPPIVGFGALYLWTSKCRFEPFGPENSTLFQHPTLKIINPRNNPSSHDCCVRAVPFAQVRPELLEDARRGGTRMVEAFSAGMWGGYGYGIQRNIMRMTKDESNINDLWTKQELLRDSYEPGTAITNHFLVLDKTSSSLTFRGCLGPQQSPPPGPLELDNLFELSATVDEKSQRVEFRLKCITFDGTDLTAREDPYGGFPGFLHRQYAKLLVEAAVKNCVR